MSRIRTFIAVEISKAIRRRAVDLIHRLDKSGASVNWVPPENMHLTLKFLGNVHNRELSTVCDALETTVWEMPDFSIQCHGAGVFPRPERPRTVWMGVGQGRDELIRLQGLVEKALEPFRFRREQRRFTPHLTIGRVQGGSPNLDDLAERIAKCEDYEAGETIVSEVVVFSSEIKRGAPEYNVIGRATLGG